MMVRHVRAIMQSPRHLTQEADLAFLQRISKETPLQMVLKALGSMLIRIALPSDFPCYAAEDIQHRLQALRGNMVALSEAPAERGCQLLAVPDNAPVFECQFCGQRFATLHMVKSHEGKMHKQHAPKHQLPDASHYAVGGVPTCRFCGDSFSKWAHLKRHISLNRCAGLRLKSTTTEPAAAAPVGTVTPDHCPEVENMARASETLCQAEQPQVTLATEHVPARVVSAVAPVQSLIPTPLKAGPPSATADNAMPAHFSEHTTTDINPSVWTSVQQTKDHNRALPVAEWSAVRAAGNLENIVKVQGVKEIIKQTCCVCGQWIAATNGVRKHLRDAHPDIWKPHESTIKHRAKLWSKSAFSPCTLCAAVVAEPRKHPACCIVFAQACLLELLNRAATGDDRPTDGRHAGDGAVRTCPHTPTGTNGGGTGGTADGGGHHAQATATIQTAAGAQGQREGRRQSTGGQKSRSLQQFFGQGSSSSVKQGRATASRSQLHRLECDAGFFLVLATAPAAGTVIPTMFNVAELWRKQQAESPELLTCSLGIMMFRCLLQELNNRLCLALKSKEVLDGLAKQEMITDKQDWRYMTWDKDNGKLVPDGTRSPMTTKDLQKSLQEAASLLQNSPEMITRFCSTQKLLPETTNAMIPFLIDVTLRDGRMYQILHQWSQLSVWRLLNGRLRPARAKRTPIEIKIQNLLKAMS